MKNWIKSLLCNHNFEFVEYFEKWNGNPPYDCYKKQYTVSKCSKCKKNKVESTNVYF